MTDAVSLPEKNTYCLVEFAYGDLVNAPRFARYTDFDQPQGTFISVPDMEIKLAPNTGGLGDAVSTIELPLDAFTSMLAGGPRFEVYVFILEVSRSLSGAADASNLAVFRGRVTESTKNPDGRAQSVKISAKPAKALLAKPLGLPANNTCVWQLFGRGCSVDGLVRTGHTVSTQITVLPGKKITVQSPNSAISAPTSPGGRVDRYFERGYFEKDGLRIGIHRWEQTDPFTFYLRSKPPPDWLLSGAGTILLVPGCHKDIEDCREVWNNEIDFMGFGYAILAYNPIFESPQ